MLQACFAEKKQPNNWDAIANNINDIMLEKRLSGYHGNGCGGKIWQAVFGFQSRSTEFLLFNIFIHQQRGRKTFLMKKQ